MYDYQKIAKALIRNADEIVAALTGTSPRKTKT